MQADVSVQVGQGGHPSDAEAITGPDLPAPTPRHELAQHWLGDLLPTDQALPFDITDREAWATAQVCDSHGVVLRCPLGGCAPSGRTLDDWEADADHR